MILLSFDFLYTTREQGRLGFLLHETPASEKYL